MCGGATACNATISVPRSLEKMKYSGVGLGLFPPGVVGTGPHFSY